MNKEGPFFEKAHERRKWFAEQQEKHGVKRFRTSREARQNMSAAKLEKLREYERAKWQRTKAEKEKRKMEAAEHAAFLARNKRAWETVMGAKCSHQVGVNIQVWHAQAQRQGVFFRSMHDFR